MLKPLIPVSLVLAAVLVAACGGDDGDGGERLSKADFIAQADEICHEAIAATAGIEEPQSEEEGRAAFAELEAIFDGMLDDLRELQPPAEDEDMLEEMYDEIDELVAMGEQLFDPAVAEDAAEFQRWEAEMTQLEAEIKEIAETYGFESCGIEEE
jgi:hypothetical protein